MKVCEKITLSIFFPALIYLRTFAESGGIQHMNIRHKYQKSLLSLSKKTTEEAAGLAFSRDNHNVAKDSDPSRYNSDEEELVDTIPDPHLLDPKDVAILYQLQTVTQPPIKETAYNESSKPFIVEPPSRVITTRAGQTAGLTCTVRNLGDRQVSWIRGRDLHVLSSGTRVFASDSRVRVTVAGSRWSLIIRYSQPRDGGSYACQINTQEPIALWLNLTVIEARANIEASSPLYIQEGSTMTLTCTIKEELVIPGLVLWYHGDALVPRDSKRIKVVTDTTSVTTSILNITRATTADSGNYSCWPSSGKPDTAFVHVIQGDPPAAMHHGNSSPRLCSSLWHFLPAFVCCSNLAKMASLLFSIGFSRHISKLATSLWKPHRHLLNQL